MNTIPLSEPSERLIPLVSGLCARGWTIVKAPKSGRLASNRQKVMLESHGQVLRLRIGVYSVSGTGRERARERRIQITKTYISGLTRDPKYQDVIVGREKSKGLYVGVDPRRLHHGGQTSNASTFLSHNRISDATDHRMIVSPHASKLFPTGEYQAVFYPIHFDEYCSNLSSIHNGTYRGTGLFSRRGRIDVPKHDLTVLTDICNGHLLHLRYDSDPHFRADNEDLAALEVDEEAVAEYEEYGEDAHSVRGMTREEFEKICRISDENGRLGEEYVLTQEIKRLIRSKRPDLAAKVQLLSQRNVGAGYDVLSFESDGRKRHIEVKSTSGKSMSFCMSRNEWETAIRLKETYFIYRVTSVRSSPTVARKLQNPVGLETAGRIKMESAGWWIKVI